VTPAKERHAICEPRQPLACKLERHRIAVDGDQPRALVSLQQRLGVTAQTDRGVDERSVITRRPEVLDYRL
jgi:hypothetical protein